MRAFKVRSTSSTGRRSCEAFHIRTANTQPATNVIAEVTKLITITNQNHTGICADHWSNPGGASGGGAAGGQTMSTSAASVAFTSRRPD